MKKLVTFLILSLFVTALSGQVNYYVDEAATGAADGSAWTDAFTTLLAANNAIESEGSATEYIINIRGTHTTGTGSVCDLGVSRTVSVTVKGEGVDNTVLQRVDDATYPSTDNPGRFFILTTTANVNVSLHIEDLTIKNFGWQNGNGGGIVNQKNDNVSFKRCNILNGKSQSGALVLIQSANCNFSIEDSYISGLKTVNNAQMTSIIYQQRGNATIKNCVFANNYKDYTKLATNLNSTKNGVVYTHLGQSAGEVNIINNTFIDNKVINPLSATEPLTHQQAVISFLTNNLITTGNLANNIFIDNLRSSPAIPDVDIQVNNIAKYTPTVTTNNVMNAHLNFSDTDNDIDATYTYTSPEIAFVMDGSVPEVFTVASGTHSGIKYVKAVGTLIKQNAVVNAIVPTTDITGATRLSPTALGAWEAGVSSASTDASITSADYTVNEGAKTITGVAAKTTLATFESNLTPAVGANFVVYETDGTTIATDVLSDYIVKVTAEDNFTQASYTVTVDKNNEAFITSTEYTVNEGAKTIVGVATRSSLATFTSNLTPALGATIQVFEADGTTSADTVVSGYIAKVTAEDNSTSATYTITVDLNDEAYATSDTYFVKTNIPTKIKEIPYGTSKATFLSNITLAPGATAGIFERDSVTPADTILSFYKLEVRAENDIDSIFYELNVLQNDQAFVTSDVYSVGANDISNIPYGETLNVFKSNLAPAPSGSFKVYEADTATIATDLASGYKVMAVAQDLQDTVVYTVTLGANTEATISSNIYTVDESAKTIIDVAYASTLATFKSNISASAGASFEVYLADGTTVANDIATGYKVKVTSEDNSNSQSYVVTVNKNSEAYVTSTVYTVNETAPKTITNVANASTLATFKSNLTVSTAASFEVYEADSTTVADTILSDYVLIVTAEDAVSKAIYKVSVNKNVDAYVTSSVYTVNETAPKTITNVAYASGLALFKSNLTSSTGATFEVYKADGVTVADTILSDYVVIVTAEDAITKVSYKVSVNKNNDASVLSTVYSVGSGGISNVPVGETLAAFEANLTPAAGASFETYQADGTTLATDVKTGYKVIVTAEDGTTKNTYTITIGANTEAFVTSDLYTVDETSPKNISGVAFKSTLATFKSNLSAAAGASFEVYTADSTTVADTILSAYVVIVTAEDATTKAYYQVEVNKSNEAFVTSSVYTVNETEKTISNVAYASTLSAFKANITAAEGATFEVYKADSLTLADTILSSYVVKATAADATTTAFYQVSINKNDLATITSSVYVVNESDKSISSIPFDVAIAELKANLTASAGASFEVYKADTTTVATEIVSGSLVKVIAEDGVTTSIYELNVSKNNKATITSTVYVVNESDKTISSVPFAVAIAEFKSNLLASTGASFEVYDADTATIATEVVSGSLVKVIAEDAVTVSIYKVNVTISSEANLSSTVYTVNDSEKTISNVAYASSLATFKSNLLPSTGATFEVYEADTTTIADTVLSGYLVKVTSQDASNTTVYSISVNFSNVALVTSLVYTVFETVSPTIVDVPYGTGIAEFKSNLTPSEGASFEVYETDTATIADTVLSNYMVLVTAADAFSTSLYKVTVSKNKDASVTSATYTVDETAKSISDVAYATELADFKANLKAAAGASFEVYESDTITLAIDLTSGCIVMVTAEDELSTSAYKVTVNKNNDATITSAEYTVSEADKTIVDVPFATTIDDFKAGLTPATGATFEVYNADGTTIATELSSGSKVMVTAEDETTMNTYEVTVEANVAINSENAEVSIYPNPCKSVIKLPVHISTIEIYNTQGAKVSQLNNYSGIVNVSELTNGVYLVKCIDNNNTVLSVQRIVVNK